MEEVSTLVKNKREKNQREMTDTNLRHDFMVADVMMKLNEIAVSGKNDSNKRE